VGYVQDKENDKRSTQTEPGINERRFRVVGGEGVSAVMCNIRRRFEGRGWRRRRRSGCLKSALGRFRSHPGRYSAVRVRDLDVGCENRGHAQRNIYSKERERECAFILVRAFYTRESQCLNQYASKPASNYRSRLLILAKDSIQTLPSSLVTLAKG
jgi:hypothetical protein